MSARSTLPPPLQSRESSIALALWREAWQRFDACGRPMVLILCAKFPVFWFHVVAVAGAAIQALWGPSSLRPLAVWLLGWYTAIHAYEFVAIAGLLGPLHVISTPYLVWSSYTFFALFIVHALSAPLDLALRRRPNPAQPEPTSRWRAAHVAAAVALLLSVPAVAAYLWTTQVAPYQPPREGRNVRFLGRAPAREPIVGNITRYLIAEAQLRPGAPFRGYTVTFFGDPHGHLRSAVDYRGAGMSWDIYVRSREYLDQHYRNRFQEMDLWEFGIPTLEEYGQWISRQAHTFFTSLLASPRDVVHPLLLRVYVPDIDLLRALGVRFVISDMGSRAPVSPQSPTSAGPAPGPFSSTRSPIPTLAPGRRRARSLPGPSTRPWPCCDALGHWPGTRSSSFPSCLVPSFPCAPPSCASSGAASTSLPRAVAARCCSCPCSFPAVFASSRPEPGPPSASCAPTPSRRSCSSRGELTRARDSKPGPGDWHGVAVRMRKNCTPSGWDAEGGRDACPAWRPAMLFSACVR
jgi:hypothetical protein